MLQLTTCHLPSVASQFPDGTNFLFAPGALAALSSLAWLFMTATFGVGAVTGLFVPSLLVRG